MREKNFPKSFPAKDLPVKNLPRTAKNTGYSTGMGIMGATTCGCYMRSRYVNQHHITTGVARPEVRSVADIRCIPFANLNFPERMDEGDGRIKTDQKLVDSKEATHFTQTMTFSKR